MGYIKTNCQISPYSFPGCPDCQYTYIITQVAKYYNISVRNMLKRDRKRKYVEPRQIAMVLCFNFIEKSTLQKVGEKIGFRDPATVLHACKTISNLRETNKKFAKEITKLINILQLSK